MRILWAMQEKILPPNTGGKIRSINILKQLAHRHEITFLSYYDGPLDAAYENSLRAEFPTAEPIAAAWPQNPVGLGFSYARWLPTRMPFGVAKYVNARVRARLAAWYVERHFDVAVCDFLATSGNFPERLTLPSVLFQHNVESMLWERRATHEANSALRVIYRLEARRMLAYEAAAVQRFHHVIAVSEHDKSLMARWVDPTRISVAPTGVDLAAFGHGAPDPSEAPPLAVFVGSMDWEPNRDGIEWFCREVWPLVAAACPDAVLRVVGRNPPARIRGLASPQIQITGTVPSVVEHLHAAAVVIVPLRIAGGTRLKIYEAMAARRPVVSTSVGAEGLDVTNGRDIVLADDPPAFAQALTRLLSTPAERTRLGDAAAATARRFGWEDVAGRFEACLATLLHDETIASAPRVR